MQLALSGTHTCKVVIGNNSVNNLYLAVVEDNGLNVHFPVGNQFETLVVRMALKYRAAIECALMTYYLFFQCQECHFAISLYATITPTRQCIANLAKQNVGISYLTVNLFKTAWTI